METMSDERPPDSPTAPRSPVLAAPAPGETPAAAFASLVELMRLLRSPEGCPWDREQTLDSLLPFVLEEAHEVVEAVERRDWADLEGEIGDLVFEGVFLAQLCGEDGAFTITDALNHVRAKLVRRHPHVFAPDESTASVTTAGAVKDQWDVIKAAERAEAGRSRTSILDGVPAALPALLGADRLARRAATVGFDWPTPEDVIEKIEEELGELRDARASGDAAAVAEEVGDLLFAVANLARKLDIDSEAALRAANRKFRARFAAMEARLAREGQTLEDTSLEDKEAAWQAVKQDESTS
jgi:MazG family protein